MNSKHNKWKSWKLFTVVAVTAVILANLSKVASVNAHTISESTIQERVAKVRERLKQQEEQIRCESENPSSLQNSLETENEKTLEAQWWNDWNDWNNWGDGPWNNWSNWNDGWNKWNNWNNLRWNS